MEISAMDRAPGSCPVCGEKKENFLEGGVCPYFSVAHALNESIIENWKKAKTVEKPKKERVRWSL